METSDLIRIQNQIRNELESFRNELNKLSVPNYPSSTCQKIIEYLLEKVSLYEKTLINIIEDSKGQNDHIQEQSLRRLITKIHNPLVKQDIKFLNWLSKAQTRNVPWSFVHCIEEIAKQIIPGRDLLIYCENQFNYGICWSQSETLAPYPYYVLSLPRLHRTNILWHVLIGHELFHPRCDEFISRYNQKILTNIRNAVTENYQKFVSDDDSENLFSESERKDRIDSLTDIIHLAWRRAMEELLSDMACVEIFGPAAVLAMKAFSACSQKNDVPEPSNNFYPSWQYRFEIVWNNFIDIAVLNKIYSNIEKREIVESFKAEIERIQNLAEKAEGEHLVSQHKLAKIAYDEIKNLIPQAIDFVKETTSKDVSKWYDKVVINQVPYLVKRLENGIPPNEVIIEINDIEKKYKTQAAFLPGILLAGWIYETYWQDKYNENSNMMNYKTISRLLLKSCEDIETISKIQQCQS